MLFSASGDKASQGNDRSRSTPSPASRGNLRNGHETQASTSHNARTYVPFFDSTISSQPNCKVSCMLSSMADFHDRTADRGAAEAPTGPSSSRASDTAGLSQPRHHQNFSKKQRTPLPNSPRRRSEAAPSSLQTLASAALQCGMDHDSVVAAINKIDVVMEYLQQQKGQLEQHKTSLQCHLGEHIHHHHVASGPNHSHIHDLPIRAGPSNEASRVTLPSIRDLLDSTDGLEAPTRTSASPLTRAPRLAHAALPADMPNNDKGKGPAQPSKEHHRHESLSVPRGFDMNMSPDPARHSAPASGSSRHERTAATPGPSNSAKAASTPAVTAPPVTGIVPAHAPGDHDTWHEYWQGSSVCDYCGTKGHTILAKCTQCIIRCCFKCVRALDKKARGEELTDAERRVQPFQGHSIGLYSIDWGRSKPKVDRKGKRKAAGEYEAPASTPPAKKSKVTVVIVNNGNGNEGAKNGESSGASSEVVDLTAAEDHDMGDAN